MKIGSVSQYIPAFSRAPEVTKPRVSEDVTFPAQDKNNIVDFSNMTPKEMRAVSQHMYERGEIDLTEMGLLQMSGPIGKAGPNGEFVPFTAQERAQIDSTPVDYKSRAAGAMQWIESRGGATDPKSGYADWQKILSILQQQHDAMPRVDLKA